ncbi:DUF72 domain-containing protein [Rubrolithibacter danxiaensis]|uniref:DUF72 domain-containing protein n=1 Tax=Rubrolithibacter danxiaensis TaxID=3390805 RepID=UPI003BF86C57
MDFGFIPPHQLDQVNFKLPADSELTKRVLPGKRVNVKTEVYIGCAKWGRKEWVGMIYPEKTKDAQFLDEYVKHFNSIELNALFYMMPAKEQIRKWKEKAEKEQKNFKFCPKFTQTISHIKRLKNAEEATDQFLAAVSEFGQFLGPCFLQLSDNFGPKNFDILKSYLEYLPQDFEVFVEVRHRDWFSDVVVRKELFEMLRSVQKGAVITDASGRRDCLHMELPIPKAFIRFVGNSLHLTDYARIDEWAARIKVWVEQGLESVYFFLHQHDEKDTPILADYTVQTVNELLNISLESPKFIKTS